MLGTRSVDASFEIWVRFDTQKADREGVLDAQEPHCRHVNYDMGSIAMTPQRKDLEV